MLVSAILRSQPNVQPGADVATNGASRAANFLMSAAQFQAADRPVAAHRRDHRTVNLLLPGQIYGDRVNNLDLRVAKIVRVKRTKANVGIDLYNLTNANTGTTFEATYDPASQRRALDAPDGGAAAAVRPLQRPVRLLVIARRRGAVVTAGCALLLLVAGPLSGRVSSAAQPAPPAGTLERVTVHGQALEGNLEGDSPDRAVVVYLPPSYAKDRQRRFPVVYFLHGYAATADTYSPGARHAGVDRSRDRGRRARADCRHPRRVHETVQRQRARIRRRLATGRRSWRAI